MRGFNLIGKTGKNLIPGSSAPGGAYFRAALPPDCGTLPDAGRVIRCPAQARL